MKCQITAFFILWFDNIRTGYLVFTPYFCQSFFKQVMKKILTGLVLLLAAALAAVYLFIPGKIKIDTSISLKAALPGVSRSLLNDSNWSKWWPGKTPFIYNDRTYAIAGKIFNTFDIDIQNGIDTLNSRMELILIKADTMTINWSAEQQTSYNPFQRFSDYRKVKTTEKNMLAILNSMKAYMKRPENIYGITINETKVMDSVLVSTSRSFEQKPSAEDINAMIQRLRKYIAQNNAIEKNSPMLNILKIDSSHYEVMTAIPVDRQLPNTNEFASKFLLKGGYILEAQIQGGPATIENSLKEFENYRADYKYNSPAIPYQLLVTDRIKEADTTKWITKLYYPVF